MSWFEALVLGVVQGLTEYLPVSSSGHLTIGAALFGIDGEQNLTFNIVVHVATVLSTCTILWKEIVWLLRDLFKLKWNDGTRYVVNILVSMIPVAVVGFFFKEQVEAIFEPNLTVVGCCLLVTAALLAFSFFARPRQREEMSPLHAFVIGLAQAVAVLPVLSRSGSTIATGLLLGNKKEMLAQFSFLMVIPPILGEALLDARKLFGGAVDVATTGVNTLPLLIGFLAAYVSGCLACKWMIGIVRRGKLIWFALYCAVVALLCLVLPAVL